MTLLPIAPPATPPNGAAAGEATTTNGDFAALLAVVAGTTPSPNGDSTLPEAATSAVAAPEPQPDPPGSGRDQVMPPDAVAVVAMPMPARATVPASPRVPTPTRPAERPIVGVPAAPTALEASPALAEPSASSVFEIPESPAPPTGTPLSPAPPTEAPLPSASPVEAPLPSASPIEAPLPSASPIGTSLPSAPLGEAESAPVPPTEAPPPAPPSFEMPPPPAAEVPPAPVVARSLPSPDEAVRVEFEGAPIPADRPLSEVVPPGRGRPSVTVPASRVAVEASPVLVEVSPALVAVPPIGEESPVAPENLLSEPRVVEKPLPRVDVPTAAPLPAAVVRSEATLPADAAAPTPVAPPAVPDQIVSAVVPLHGRGDGRHEVTLELRPEDLGTIRVEVSVEQQTVHLTLHAAEPATARLLSIALAELRTALADAGLRTGHLAVSPDGGSATGRRSRPEPPAAETARDDSTTPERVRTVRPSAAGRLDLLL